LSQREFAEKAGLDQATLLKAIQGKAIHPKTFGKILIALAAIPAAEIPPGLTEQSA
jgi:predicted transcriptional regulator